MGNSEETPGATTNHLPYLYHEIFRQHFSQLSTQPFSKSNATKLKATCAHMVAWQTEPQWDSSLEKDVFSLRMLEKWNHTAWAIKSHFLYILWRGYSNIFSVRCKLKTDFSWGHCKHSTCLLVFVWRGLFPLLSLPTLAGIEEELF